MSASTSNLLPKRDSPAHNSVADFVRSSNPAARFTLEGEPDGQEARLCRVVPPPPSQARAMGGAPGIAGMPAQPPPNSGDCINVAMEVKDLFATMQGLGFFCQLPHDPKATPHIRCERIPQ